MRVCYHYSNFELLNNSNLSQWLFTNLTYLIWYVNLLVCNFTGMLYVILPLRILFQR